MSQRVSAHICALLAVVVWGLTFVASKVLLKEGAQPYEILALRFVLAWCVLTLLRPRGIAFEGFTLASLKHELPFALCGFFGTALYFLAENSALQYTLTSHVGILSSTAPFLTGLMFWLVYKERPSRAFFIGFVLALIGLVMVATNGSIKAEDFLLLGPHPLLGDLLCLGAAWTWAVYSIGMREIREDEKCDAIALTKRIFFWGLIAIALIGPFMGFSISWVRPDPLLLACLAFLALLGSGLCYVIWNKAISVLGELITSLYIYLIPVVTLLASVLFLGESMSAVGYLGIVLIICGLVVSNKQSDKSEKSVETTAGKEA